MTYYSIQVTTNQLYTQLAAPYLPPLQHIGIWALAGGSLMQQHRRVTSLKG